jgi:hypothetical protein
MHPIFVLKNGCDKSSDLNSTIEKPITLLKNPANDGKEVEKLSIDVVGSKFKQKKMKVLKIKKELLLSKIEVKPTCSIGLPKWQEKKLQKLSAKKIREEGFAWVPNGSIQAHKDDAQVSGATKAKERRRRFEKQLPSWKFTPDHQSHWSASTMFSTYAYVEFIPWYAWLSLSSLF